jgi:hypothetical protein
MTKNVENDESQLAKWREEFERPARNATPMLAILLYAREPGCEYTNNYAESEWQGYLRRCRETEQAFLEIYHRTYPSIEAQLLAIKEFTK